MRRSQLALVLAPLSALILACATSPRAAPSNDQSPEASSGTDAGKSKTDQSRLTTAEITAADLPTAYDLVDRLRRAWLRRDAATGNEVVVYMDQQNIGGATKLRDIPSVDVAELRYLPHDEAVRRWGSQVDGSVIVVTRRR